MIRILVTIAGGCVFAGNICVGSLLTLAALLGIFGAIADTSLRENQIAGLLYGLFSGVAFANAAALFPLLDAMLRGESFRMSRILRGLAYTGNAGCILVGILLCWAEAGHSYLFGFPFLSVVLTGYAVLNASTIAVINLAASPNQN